MRSVRNQIRNNLDTWCNGTLPRPATDMLETLANKPYLELWFKFTLLDFSIGRTINRTLDERAILYPPSGGPYDPMNHFEI